MIQADVALKIKKLLNKQNKSAEKLAYEIGMSKSYLYAFLSCKKDITLKNLERISDGLDIKIVELFRD